MNKIVLSVHCAGSTRVEVDYWCCVCQYVATADFWWHVFRILQCLFLHPFAFSLSPYLSLISWRIAHVFCLLSLLFFCRFLFHIKAGPSDSRHNATTAGASPTFSHASPTNIGDPMRRSVTEALPFDASSEVVRAAIQSLFGPSAASVTVDRVGPTRREHAKQSSTGALSPMSSSFAVASNREPLGKGVSSRSSLVPSNMLDQLKRSG